MLVDWLGSFAFSWALLSIDRLGDMIYKVQRDYVVLSCLGISRRLDITNILGYIIV